jgi:hypothetical protein
MATLKTVPTDQNIETFIKGLPEKRQGETEILIQMMSELTGQPPVVWGSDIVGFDQVHIVYDSKREIDYFVIGFSPRKTAITVYLSIETNKKVFDKLGKHQKGVGCLYINKLSDIDLDELKRILKESIESLSIWKSV